MSHNVKKIALLIAGIFCLLLGFLGLVLPFLQGIFFLAIGVVLVSLCIPAVRNVRRKYSSKYPTVHKKIETLEAKVEQWLGK